MRFQDQVVIVTGGSQGIGRAYVKAFAREGAKVVIADIAEPGDFLKEVEGPCLFVETDIRKEESTRSMARTVLDCLGRIDVLVNNAGRTGRTARWPLMEIRPEDWDEVFAVNARGTMLCVKAVVPAFQRAGRGAIVNIASNTFHLGNPGMLTYVASKGAVVAMTRSLARELGPLGIRVNAVAPDWIPLGEDLENPPPFGEVVLKSRVFQRHMAPEDAVGAVLFLASPESGFITGVTLSVNGGSHFV
ncbi:MAG: SDR family oxidoreductase [Candidatus Tectomicrobia bacterium]|nr:SDR family oxidoreductase [Candidatus Tectomicrobia bacterium]